ncbi:MAG: FHA domain-containing protein [Spirochaetales bacterium]|nr:FHA domain-containing protein [Spirochaetales bacterium]
MLFGRKFCREGHLMDPSWRVCPVCITPIVGWLVYSENNRTKSVYAIREGKNMIGRGVDCDVRILLDSVKRHHATLTASSDGIMIHNSGSGGRILVNRNESVQDIIDGDLLTLGDLEFKFKCIY